MQEGDSETDGRRRQHCKRRGRGVTAGSGAQGPQLLGEQGGLYVTGPGKLKDQVPSGWWFHH